LGFVFACHLNSRYSSLYKVRKGLELTEQGLGHGSNVGPEALGIDRLESGYTWKVRIDEVLVQTLSVEGRDVCG